MKFSLLLIAAGLGTATAASSKAVDHDPVVSYHCGDLVVIGRFKNLDYEHIEDENDVLGHGWATARVRVRRVLTGSPGGRVVPVRYYTHAYYREDRDFVMVINPADPEGRTIRTVHLLDGAQRPRLARRCKPASSE